MASNNSEINAAVNEATANLRALHPEDSERLLDEAYAKRGLKRRKRLSPEAKAARDLADRQALAQARIDRLAAKAGLHVLVARPVDVEALRVDHPEIAERIDAVRDGTAETVEFDWETKEEQVASERYQEAFAQDQSPTVTVISVPE